MSGDCVTRVAEHELFDAGVFARVALLDAAARPARKWPHAGARALLPTYNAQRKYQGVELAGMQALQNPASRCRPPRHCVCIFMFGDACTPMGLWAHGSVRAFVPSLCLLVCAFLYPLYPHWFAFGPMPVCRLFALCPFWHAARRAARLPSRAPSLQVAPGCAAWVSAN